MSKQYDKNMISATNDNENLLWYEVNDKDFDLYGDDPGENDIFTCRIPEEFAKPVNEGVYNMRGFAAGVRMRFSTDSPLIAIRAEYDDGRIPNVVQSVEHTVLTFTNATMTAQKHSVHVQTT